MKVQEILIEGAVAKPALENAKFPIATKAVTAGAKGALRVERFEQACATIVAAMKAGEIVNTQVEDMKYSISYFIREAFEQAISKEFTWGKGGSGVPEELQWLMNPDTARTITAYEKKLDKMKDEKSHPMWKAAKELCVEFKPFIEAMDWVKSNTVKASVKRAEAKAAKNAETETYNKKFTDHKDVKKVVNLLKGQASAIEKELHETQLKYLNRIVADYQKHLKEGQSDFTKIYEKNPIYRFTIQGLVKRIYAKDRPTRMSDAKVFELEKNWKELIEQSAARTAAEIVDHFVYKNSGKLSYIIFNKNNLKEVTLQNVTVSRGAVEAQLHLVFADKSEFIADSSVVYAVSVLGKPFYRYPTVFKNVKLPDGSKMPQPSEQRMDEIFAVTK
jgi:hypothetical protein